MNEFEDRLKTELNDRVDEQVGPRRLPPPFDRDAAARRQHSGIGRTGRRQLPWTLPLVAAASVVAVTIGAVAATGVLADKRSVPPATVMPTPTPSSTGTLTSPAPTGPTDGGAPTTSQRTTSVADNSHRSTPPPAPVIVQLAGAAISLPHGWVARDYSAYLPRGVSTLAAQQWCLTPASIPASTAPRACPLTLGTIPPTGNPVDVDVQGGWSSNPHYCFQSPPTTNDEQTGDRQFGGRSADWRRWEIACRGQHFLIEQYVVATGPGFILFSERSDPTVHDAMTQIATRSTLPAQASAIRYMDRGYVRSLVHTATGVRISLDRVVVTSHGMINNNLATYDYFIPSKVFEAGQGNGAIKVGKLAYLSSDGTTVRTFYGD